MVYSEWFVTIYAASITTTRYLTRCLQGFQSISDYNAPPVFQTLVSESKVTSPVFGFTLVGSGSELYLGGIDTSKFSGSLTYTPVTEAGYWQINFGGASVGSKTIFSKSTEAIVDTGTTMVRLESTSNAPIKTDERRRSSRTARTPRRSTLPFRDLKMRAAPLEMATTLFHATLFLPTSRSPWAARSSLCRRIHSTWAQSLTGQAIAWAELLPMTRWVRFKIIGHYKRHSC